MRKILFLSALASFMLCTGTLIAQSSGGPDNYGYIWKDQTAAGGPVFAWKDISTIGTQVTGLTDDNSVAAIPMGFSFHYYWVDYNKVNIGSNGWIAFNNVGNIASCFPDMPAAGGSGDNFVAPFMTDLTLLATGTSTGNPGKVYKWTNNVDSFIIAWVNTPYWQTGNPAYTPGNNTFEVIFTSRDSSITFQYLSTDAAGLSTQCSGNGSGRDISIGMENITGNDGLQHSVDIVPNAGTAVKFYYPAVVGAQIIDPAPYWVGNSDNAGQFVITGNPTSLSTQIRNVGNAASTHDIFITGKIKDSLTNTVFTSLDTIVGGLASNASSIVYFAPYTFTTFGQYTFEVSIIDPTDLNSSNNKSTVEISAITQGPSPDCMIGLTYATHLLPDPASVIAWGSGGGGGGIKIVPPGYPIEVRSADAFIRSIDTAQGFASPTGFSFELWSVDSATGNPGVMLTSEHVTAANVVNMQWNHVTFTTPQTITSRGFFLGWLADGDSLFLLTEQNDPISRRTYEVLTAGQWATYRDLTTTDFLLQANAAACSLVTREPDLARYFNMNTFPNPTSGLTTVAYEMGKSAPAHFTMVNMYGQVIFNREFNYADAGNHSFQIEMQDYAPGVYFLTMVSNGAKQTSKIVVSK